MGMKSDPTLRDICGTESGYRKHRRTGEQWCLPCNEAHNEYRRNTYSFEKNQQYTTTYKKNHPDRVRESSKKVYYKKAYSPEVIFYKEERARQAALTKITAWSNKRWMIRLVKQDRQADLDLARLFAKEERLQVKHVREVQEQLRKQTAKEAERQGRLKARAAKEAELAEARELRRQEQANRPINHGLAYRAYTRCSARPEGSCEECRAFVAGWHREYRKRNPEKVSAREKAWEKANPEKVRDIRRRNNTKRERRGRENGYEPYRRMDILERDSYTCYLCGELVDMSAPSQVGEPGWERYPHLDHVVPLSKGGPDTPDNVRTTHASCNISKSASLVKLD